LVANDLGVLAAITGDGDAACRGWEEALAFDGGCSSSRLNLAFLRAEQGAVGAAPAVVDSESLTPPPAGGGAVKFAILGFLFNWPSTGGGIVPTVELARFLARAGFEVRHYHARFPAWGVGRVDESPPFPSEAIEFDESTWEVSQIQQQFRAAVDAF